jgi:glutaredoxin
MPDILSDLFAKIRVWLGRRPGTSLGHVQVLVYTRCGCHLCEAAWQILQEAQRQYRFALESIDVDSDPDLTARYGKDVPVVIIDGRPRFRGSVNNVLLKRLLLAEATKKGNRSGARPRNR